ncbi:MAG: UDP-N-acetylmuramoyl-L-alanyl-D-glutamate--2,6-diaminopimelate ligase [Dethiobacteria bacterium]|jgi:UDP-N-acetylmuramoyl-L-alanyl-D-glutamate--2,6-diaminopimelate ligase|nr:UDP-N-acetylmuramoyl-L-alanyl-D-glutamate--2,6-diaminopimelate ligase [Bacillota bacterium]
MYLKELLADLDYLHFNGEEQTEITTIAYDSRKVIPGSLFICLKGAKYDGHLFAADAVAAGAAAVVGERELSLPVPQVLVKNPRRALSRLAAAFYRYPSRRLRLTGVTGTNGKTTTTHLLYAINERYQRKAALLGTNGVKLEGRYRELKLTTPEAADLQQIIYELLKAGVGHLAMEVSSIALVQHRVDDCEFDTVVFTNLTHDHLDFHGSMEAYLEAKALLLEKMQGKKTGKRVVINADDPFFFRLLPRCKYPVYTYALEQDADFQALEVKSDQEGTSFILSTPEGKIDVRLNIRGRFNIYNALAAASAAYAEGVPLAMIAAGLEAVRSIPGRLERLDYKQDYQIFLDFAHTPDSLENVLRTLAAYKPKRLITVFGCPGNRDKEKRPIMGRIAEQLSDIVIITSDNPADEDPLAIIEEIKSGMKTEPLVIPERKSAVNKALSLARAGDIILLAGKGHETYQLVGDKLLPYSEREVIAEFFS